MKPILSIIVPCFNEEAAVPVFYRETARVLRAMQLDAAEFVFVDDGSTDATVSVLRELSKHDSRVRYISFSRNFGKEAALYAGLSKASGSLTAVMDADLQDPPALLP